MIDMIICLKCETAAGSLANFCKECGAKLPLPIEEIDAKEKQEWIKWQCGKEGHFMQAGFIHKYCNACGVKLARV